MKTEYPKIQGLFKRDPITHKFILWDYSLPEFEYLIENEWWASEKIDGTNCRLIWDGEKLDIRGRTDNAQFPISLMDKIRSYHLEEKLKEVFNDSTLESPAILYCEGYGNKIQKNGSLYIKDGVDIILFDIRIAHWWLERENLVVIAEKLGIKIVPYIKQDTLRNMVYDIRSHNSIESLISEQKMFAEGLVCQPLVPLRQRNGNRIITKLKMTDFV